MEMGNKALTKMPIYGMMVIIAQSIPNNMACLTPRAKRPILFSMPTIKYTNITPFM
jgi:hypothetical protein